MTCGATKTPMWRTNTDGQKTLCNACGVRLHREQKKSKACSTAQLREAAVPPTPDAHAAQQETDSHVLLRSRAATCHIPAAPAADQQVCAPSPVTVLCDAAPPDCAHLSRLQRHRADTAQCRCGVQRPIIFRGDVAAGYDGGLMRKRAGGEGAVSPRTKASRTRSMPDPAPRAIPADTAISWIVQQLKVRAPLHAAMHNARQRCPLCHQMESMPRHMQRPKTVTPGQGNGPGCMHHVGLAAAFAAQDALSPSAVGLLAG